MSDDPHEDVRSRLAAEPTPRMPDDIAARLQAALATEVQDRASRTPTPSAQPATVTPLPRRGRWKAPLLTAAGIVAVVAIGVPVVNQASDQSRGDGGSSGGIFSSDSAGSGSAQDAPDAAAPEKDESAGPATKGMLERFRDSPMVLHRSTFAADVARYLDPPLRNLSSRSRLVADVKCSGVQPDAPGAPDATLDGDPAVVLTERAPSGGVRVKAVVCGEKGPTVAARASLD